MPILFHGTKVQYSELFRKQYSEPVMRSNVKMNIGDRIKQILDDSPDKSSTEAAKYAGLGKSTLSELISGRSKSSTKLHLIADYLNVSVRWLETGKGPMRPPDANASRYDLMLAREDSQGAGTIMLLNTRGSCGGGSINWDAEPRRPLVKEESWFKRYKVTPKDVVAVWADGDSMADFIIDGDIVFFDVRKNEPRSGVIYLIEHPDGLRIKRLRREIDGSWKLESNNPDKHRFPDERVTPDQEDLLIIKGEFIYRQGG